MGTFWLGEGVGITFQMRTTAQIPQKRAALGALRELTTMINKDIFQTFEKEGALEGFSKWQALSEPYRTRKEKAGFGNRILTRKWKLGDAASNGELVFVNNGERLVIGYRFNSANKSTIEPYTLPIYYGRRTRNSGGTKVSKAKRRVKRQILGKDGFMPGRPYVRIKKSTEQSINTLIGDLWAERKMRAYFVGMANE
jgi:hypothetical protein